MNADYGLVGKQISFYRHQVGLTQEQLAEACNLSVSYLNRIENGRKKASLDVSIPAPVEPPVRSLRAAIPAA